MPHSSDAATLEAFRYRRGELKLLDQLQLPLTHVYVDASTVDAAWQAIRSMTVRGAPAIAIAAALGLAAEVHNRRASYSAADAAAQFLLKSLKHLETSRPTAVNLFEASARLSAEIRVKQAEAHPGPAGAQQVIDAFIDSAEAMLARDVADNRAIGHWGAEAILAHHDGPVQLLTHCNTGSLATAGYGTALGVIRSIHARGRLQRAWAGETRPYNQGARLTAYELVFESIPGTLICDSMAAWLMKTHPLHAVVVGADRVVANGDTANKIGTYQLALIADAHGVPFYVAAPTTSVDISLSSGDEIPIEMRPERELTHVLGQRLAAPGIPAWNPAFDITPGHLITGIITERGLLLPEKDGRYDLSARLAAPS